MPAYEKWERLADALIVALLLGVGVVLLLILAQAREANRHSRENNQILRERTEKFTRLHDEHESTQRLIREVCR